MNFNIEVRGSYFHDKSKWGDLKPNIQQADFGAMSKLARKFGRHYIEMDLGYDGYWGIKDYSDYTDHIARAGLHYAYTSDFLELAIGADYYYDHIATTFNEVAPLCDTSCPHTAQCEQPWGNYTVCRTRRGVAK